MLSTALPKDVRRKLRFIRRLCVADYDGARAHKITSLAAFCLENRDANSELAKAYVKYYTALALQQHRAYRDSMRELEESMYYCIKVKPLELADLLRSAVSRRIEETRLGAYIDFQEMRRVADPLQHYNWTRWHTRFSKASCFRAIK